MFKLLLFEEPNENAEVLENFIYIKGKIIIILYNKFNSIVFDQNHSITKSLMEIKIQF